MHRKSYFLISVIVRAQKLTRTTMPKPPMDFVEVYQLLQPYFVRAWRHFCKWSVFLVDTFRLVFGCYFRAKLIIFRVVAGRDLSSFACFGCCGIEARQWWFFHSVFGSLWCQKYVIYCDTLWTSKRFDMIALVHDEINLIIVFSYTCYAAENALHSHFW